MDAYCSFRGLSISRGIPSGTPQPLTLLSATNNSSAALSRLDLCDIQRILSLASGTPSSGSDECRSNVEYARTARFTSQVNRCWRAAALGLPSIWLGPVLSWHSAPAWLDTVLHRSYPLPFDACIPRNIPHDALLVVLQHVWRMRTLQLELETRDVWNQVEELLAQREAPYLETFSVIIPPAYRRGFGLPPPRHLFCGFAPNLTRFTTVNCRIHLTPKLFSALEVLIIHEMQFIPVSQLLDVLRNIDKLKVLDIRRPADNVTALSQDKVVPRTLHERISMFYLTSLSLTAPISICAEILRTLLIPLTCDITVECCNACKGRDLQDIGVSLGHILSQWGCSELTGQQTVSISATSITFAVSGEPQDFDNLHPTISLTVSWPAHEASTLEIFFAFFPMVARIFDYCQALPMTIALYASTGHFSIPGILDAVRALLRNWLVRMYRVQKLMFMNNYTFTLCGPLLYQDDSDDLLPVLGDLTLQGVNFRISQKQQWQRLLRIVQSREDAGSIIFLIDFVNCTPAVPRHIYDLEEHGVSDFLQDGIKLPVDYSDDDMDVDSDGYDSDRTIRSGSSY